MNVAIPSNIFVMARYRNKIYVTSHELINMFIPFYFINLNTPQYGEGLFPTFMEKNLLLMVSGKLKEYSIQ
jgi:hypothetical protein